jgi:hypothetical protein
VAYDPSTVWSIDSFPVVVVDRYNQPLNLTLLLYIFISNTSSTYSANNSCVCDVTSNSLDGPSLHDFVSSQPPVIDNPPVRETLSEKL